MGVFLRGILVLSIACGVLLLILYCVSPLVLTTKTIRKVIPRHTKNKFKEAKMVKFIPRTAVESFHKPCKQLEGFRPKILLDLEKKPPKDLFIYSAYYDLRKERRKAIRIFGLTVKQPPNYYCQLFYKDGAVYSGEAIFVEIEANKKNTPLDLNHFPYMILCDEFQGKTPLFVSLTQQPCHKNPPNAIPVVTVSPKTESELPEKTLVFVETLYNFHSHYNLLEFMEYQKLLGADHVILYDYFNVTKDVENVIKKYVKDGFMTIQEWKLKKQHHFKSEMKFYIGFQEHPHHWRKKHGSPNAFEHIIHINDCLYRFMNSYKYIIRLNPHEFLIPQNRSVFTYRQIIDRVYNLKLLGVEKATSMAFPGAVFCNAKKTGQHQLQIGKNLNRDKVNPGNKVTIFNPRRILFMSENKVSLHQPGFGETVAVYPKVAILHHYKKPHQMACTMMDQSALRFASKLLQNVNKVCTELNLKTIK